MAYDSTPPNASSVRPVLEGDEIDGESVRGFAWKAPAPGQRSGHHDDQLLLAGDEALPEPPDRPVPQTSDGIGAFAPVPPADLGKDRVIRATDVDPSLPSLADALLDAPGKGWHGVIRPLLAAVHATGHRVWLAGGAVRDTVIGVPADKVKDLDMAGTAPPGRFVDAAYQALRAAGKAEYRMSITPNSLVCAVAVTRGRRIIEYRGLSTGGFRYPAVGSRLSEDARYRDFSFNSLIYDALDHEVFDPSGQGLTDLLAEPRQFRVLKEVRTPFDLAMVLLRGMKFALRWQDATELDLSGFSRWVAGLPADLAQSLSPHEWSRLQTTQQKLRQSPQVQRDFAATLPAPGKQLLLALIGGA